MKIHHGDTEPTEAALSAPCSLRPRQTGGRFRLRRKQGEALGRILLGASEPGAFPVPRLRTSVVQLVLLKAKWYPSLQAIRYQSTR